MAFALICFTLIALAAILARRRGPDRLWLPDRPYTIDPRDPGYAELLARSAYPLPAAPPRRPGGLGDLGAAPLPVERRPHRGDELAW